MQNLSIWDKLNKPPKHALKTIQAGRLKGKSDINPQWRYKAMTELFGVCGIGWKYTIDKKWTEQGSDGQIMAFVDISVFIKMNDQWSDPISGNGGSFLIAKEKEGLHCNDEAFKMATTDALGTAMKMLGVASEIYEGNWDGTKYIQRQEGLLTPSDVFGVYTKLIEDTKTKEGLEKLIEQVIKSADVKKSIEISQKDTLINIINQKLALI